MFDLWFGSGLNLGRFFGNGNGLSLGMLVVLSLGLLFIVFVFTSSSVLAIEGFDEGCSMG